MSHLALVTGASSGLGAAFARALAARGSGLLLVARRRERLDALAASLAHCQAVAVEVLVADLSIGEDVERVARRISELPALQLLVNNAGFGAYGLLAEAELPPQLAMVHLHVAAPLRLIHAALPQMLARRSGAIINVASIGAFLPTVGNATYCATKAALLALSQALAQEVRGQGIRVQALCPGFTRTEFHDRPEFVALRVRERIPRFLWMSPEEVVRASLSGLQRDQVVVVPGLRNRLLVQAMRTGLGDWAMRSLDRRVRGGPAFGQEVRGPP